MSRNDPSIQEVLDAARQNLRTMEHGYEDLIEGDIDRQNSGIRNIAVFGRAVTKSLQRLKSRVAGFEEWYIPYREEMKDDPLMKHFWRVRNQVLKKGENPTGNYMYISRFNYPSDLQKFEKPDGAKRFFIDVTGAGWVVELPDGSAEYYYVDLPDEIGTSGLIFTDPPSQHLEQDISHTSIEEKCRMYIEYIQELVAEAEQKWG